MPNDTLWTGGSLDDLRREFGEVYEGRTVLVTGADGFMGSHLTDALVELGATVHAFVRANSSGALNNISHLRDRLKVHFADLTDRTSVDNLVRELQGTEPDRPYVFHLGAQAHVGESWHRPYETIAANILGTLNLLQSIVDWGSSSRSSTPPARPRSTGTSTRTSPSTTTSTRRRPDPPRTVADQPEVDLRDLEGRGRLPHDELLRRVRRAGRGHAHVQQLRAAPEPAVCHRDDRDPGTDERDDRARQPRAAAGLLLLHGWRARPSHRRCPGHARRRLRLRPGREHLDARLGGVDPPNRRGARILASGQAAVDGAGAATAPDRATCSHSASGHEKLTDETGWTPKVSWEEGILQTIRWYAENRERWIGRVDWLPTGAPTLRAFATPSSRPGRRACRGP